MTILSESIKHQFALTLLNNFLHLKHQQLESERAKSNPDVQTIVNLKACFAKACIQIEQLPKLSELECQAVIDEYQNSK